MDIQPLLQLPINVGAGLAGDLGHDVPALTGPHEEPGWWGRGLAPSWIGGQPFVGNEVELATVMQDSALIGPICAHAILGMKERAEGRTRRGSSSEWTPKANRLHRERLPGAVGGVRDNASPATRRYRAHPRPFQLQR